MFPQRWQWVGLAVAALAIGPAAFAQSSTSKAPGVPPAAVVIAGAPIPQPATAQTDREFFDQIRAWRARIYVESYQKASQGKPWEQDGLKFVQDTLAELYGPKTGQSSDRWKPYVARSDALRRAGCNECVVRYLTALCRYFLDSNKNREVSEWKELLAEAENDRVYPRAFACILAFEIRAELDSRSDFDQKVLALLGQAFEEGSFAGKDDVFFVHYLFTEVDMTQSREQAEKLVTSLKGLPEWARKTILGKAQVEKGWEARGNGWAGSVTDEGWAVFEKAIGNAAQILTDAWKLRPDQPYAATEMIGVTMSSESEPSQTLRTWFDRAVSARFDYSNAYKHYEAAILPRWGGSYDEMLAFGLACAKTKRFDTEIPERLIHSVESVGDEISKRRDVFRMPGLADVIMSVDNGYLAEPKRPESLVYWQYNMLLDAWLCRRWTEAKAALDQLPNRRVTVGGANRLKFLGLGYNNLFGETELYNSPAKEEYGKARELDQQNRFSEAAAHYDAALKAAQGLQYGAAVVTMMKQINNLRVEFNKDDWTDVSPKSIHDEKWRFSNSANITVPQPGTLQIVGKGETTLSTCGMMVGENYEVQADFEFLSPLDGRHLFAITLGESPASKGITCQMYFDKETSGSLTVMREFRTSLSAKFNVGLQLKNHLHVQCWNGAITLQVNGQTVLTKFVSNDGTPSDHFGSIGFGGAKLDSDEGYRLTNIRIRPLKFDPTGRSASR